MPTSSPPWLSTRRSRIPPRTVNDQCLPPSINASYVPALIYFTNCPPSSASGALKRRKLFVRFGTSHDRETIPRTQQLPRLISRAFVPPCILKQLKDCLSRTSRL